MLKEYPNILWALESNPKLKELIFDECKDNDEILFILEDLENLLLKLKSANVKNIKGKMGDVSNLNKLNSIISELKTALYLSKGNNLVEFLPDNTSKKRSPDILCTNDELEIYLEVRRVNNNPYVTCLIDDTLCKYLKNYPYMVNSHLKEELSIPKIDADGRKLQECQVNECLDQFKKEFGENVLVKEKFEIDTQYVRFTASKIKSEIGYPGVIISEVIDVPVAYLLDYIKKQLISKAQKREDFEGEHAKKLYILVLDCFEPFIDEEKISTLLYGSITHFGSNMQNWSKEQEWTAVTSEVKKRPSWKKINQAQNSGWDSLLYKKYLIPHGYSYIDKEGLFVSNKEMENVSGVLFINTRDGFSFNPNPFCDKQINNSQIIDFMEEL